MKYFYTLLASILLIIACQSFEPKQLEQQIPKIPVKIKFDTLAWKQLKVEIEELSQEVEGFLGLYAIHTKSQFELGIKPDSLFPMASIYKLPIAATALLRVDEGALSLDKIIEMMPYENRHSSCFIQDSFGKRSYPISIERMITLMLQNSDNCTSDALLKILGGPTKVAEQMQLWGIDKININRYLIEILAHIYDKEMPKNESLWTFNYVDNIVRTSTSVDRTKGYAKLYKDPRDRASPRAMVALLTALIDGNLLSLEGRKFLENTLLGCQTGKKRIPTSLPPNILFGHKTGTFSGVVNDVGFIDLGEEGRIYYALFINSSKRGYQKDEAFIAKLLEKLAWIKI